MAKFFKTPAHTNDLLPEDQQYYTYIKKVVRHRSRQGGIRRITTPVFENESTIKTFLGEKTFKLASRNFYTVQHTDHESLILRPNLLFGMIRSYVEHQMQELPKPVELFAFEQAYLRRPGKSHEFDLYSVAIVGEEDPVLDAQLIQLVQIILKDLKVAELFQVHLSLIGCEQCRPKYLNDLEQYYYGKDHSLCTECQKQFAAGDYLGLLRCQEEDCQILAKLAPKLKAYVCKECKQHYERLREFLQALDIAYEEHEQLSVPYYNKIYFEFKAGEREVVHGGRLDHLVEKLGGEPSPVSGLAMEIPALIEVMRGAGLKVPYKDNVHVFLAQLGPDAKKKSLPLLYKLREAGIKTVGAMGKGSMNQQIDLAHKLKVDYTLLLGQMEVMENTIILRDMKKGKQKTIPFDKALPELKKLLGVDQLDKYTEGQDGLIH